MRFLVVLKKYHALIGVAIQRLEAQYGEISLARIWDGEISSSGNVSDLEFYFHGTGCTARLDGYTIDWDWNENGETVEFEAWKLWQLTQDHPEEFGPWANFELLKQEMSRLHAEGVLALADNSSGSYRLVRQS